MKKGNEVHDFLSALWPGEIPEGGNIVIVTKRSSMRPAFYPSVQEAVDAVIEVGDQSVDIYVGIAAQPLMRPNRESKAPRGTSESALAIPGLWLDLDYDKGFEDLNGVQRFLSALPFQPSILVGTGGGVHPYWLFHEYLASSSADDRRYAHGLALGWLRYCREVARMELGASLDAVADLARVMRIPGTKNAKRALAVPVTLISIDPSTRYDPSDFEQWLVEPGSSVARSTMTMEFDLVASGEPPFEKFRATADNDPDFELVFDHKKPMPVDGSISGYDLALATRAAMAAWAPQEVVNLIIAHRRRWKHEVTDPKTMADPLHLMDPGYYERLLRKAFGAAEDSARSVAAAELAEYVADEINLNRTQGITGVDQGLRVKWFQAVSSMVCVEVVDLWATDPIEGVWWLRIRCGAVLRDLPVGRLPERLLQWSFWVRAAMSSLSTVDSIPSKAPPRFRDLLSRAGTMLRVVGERAKRNDELAEYLLELAQRSPPFAEADVIRGQTFIKNDGGSRGIGSWGEPTECLFLRPSALAFDIKSGRCPKLDSPREALVSFGFIHRVVGVVDEGGNTSRSYYCFPLATLKKRGGDTTLAIPSEEELEEELEEKKDGAIH